MTFIFKDIHPEDYEQQNTRMERTSDRRCSSVFATIVRTATDALQAKYSAIVQAGYPILPKDAKNEDDNNDEGRSELRKATRSSGALYRSLLGTMSDYFRSLSPSPSPTTPRRQTPLINLGYATRVATVLHHVDAFTAFYNSFYTVTAVPIQIVVLGAGLDVTGLWCALLDGRHGHQNTHWHVVEVDVPEIVTSKANAIRQLNLLSEQPQHPPMRSKSTLSSIVVVGSADIHPMRQHRPL
jgi:Leucine carboxyl methyltransferase